jgi:hypothetical protein
LSQRYRRGLDGGRLGLVEVRIVPRSGEPLGEAIRIAFAEGGA